VQILEKNLGLKQFKLLYVGNFFEGSTSVDRFEFFRTKFECTYIDQSVFFPPYRRTINSLWRKLNFGPPINKLNNLLIDKINSGEPDIVFLDKIHWVNTKIISRFDKVNFVYFSPDDQSNLNNQNPNFIKIIKLVKLVITTKSHNIEFYKSLGIDNILYTNFFFLFKNRVVNFSLNKNLKFWNRVTIISDFEDQRFFYLNELIKSGIDVFLSGPNWASNLMNRSIRTNEHLKFEKNGIWGKEYYSLLGDSSCIHLGFLRIENSDVFTTRTIEYITSTTLSFFEFSYFHFDLLGPELSKRILFHDFPSLIMLLEAHKNVDYYTETLSMFNALKFKLSEDLKIQETEFLNVFKSALLLEKN
jgi:hypothetical protein